MQTAAAEAKGISNCPLCALGHAANIKGISNCPLCALGHAANMSKIWNFSEMDADHVDAWSKGGGSSEKNCQMLCVTHNRAKGNR